MYNFFNNSFIFIGYKTKNIKKRFAISIEKNINGKKKFVFSLLENEIEFIENKDTWVTPSLPLIVFILFGYIINILYGDILAYMNNEEKEAFYKFFSNCYFS